MPRVPFLWCRRACFGVVDWIVPPQTGGVDAFSAISLVQTCLL